MNDLVKIKVVYFKESGKFYDSGVGYFRKQDFPNCIYPRDYGSLLRKKCKLPGIMGGFWKEQFTIEINDEYPELMSTDYSGLWGEE